MCTLLAESKDSVTDRKAVMIIKNDLHKKAIKLPIIPASGP